MKPSFEFCWLWIFLLIKLFWHSCSMWNKLEWLNWFWQFLCERSSSFNPKGFYYLYACSHSLCEGRLAFFGDFNVHHKDWLTYSGGTDRSGGLCYKNLSQMVNFSTWIPDCGSHSPILLDVFISSDASILLCNASLSVGKFWSCSCLSFHWLYMKYTSECLILHKAFDHCYTNWDALGQSSWSFERCSMGGYH